MNKSKVYILGGYQSDFSLNIARSGDSVADLFINSVRSALEATQLDPKDIQVGHVANFVASLSSGQAHLGGFFGHVDRAMANMPASRHEAACASGSMALLAAMADLEAGRYDLACVAGVEVMRNLPGQQTAENLRAAAWADREWLDTPYVWPCAFDQIITEYQSRYQLDKSYLSAISKQNFDNARNNPNAQTRNWQFNQHSFEIDEENNPTIIGQIRRQDCGQMTDGAAVVFLATESRAREYAQQRQLKLEDIPFIKGWGHINAPMLFDEKLTISADHPYIFPHVRELFKQTLARAELSDISQISAMEVHDCFNITEYMILDHSGLYPAGEAWKAIEAGDISMQGRLPLNPSGGLIGLGHPVGATGVRMALDCFKQVSNTAEGYQIPQANDMMTFNLGGSTTTCASLIIGK